ncbi:MAG: pilus assembly protein PilE, partial [Candidatus Zixiibacteriota bacterium]
IGVEIQTNAIYEYAITAAQDAFTATATANLDDDATDDVWTITDAGVLTNTTNDVTA